MKKIEKIYSEDNHEWAVIARDPEKPSHIIDTNEYLITSGDETLLTDPGGSEIFPEVFSALSSQFDPRSIKAIFASHQDPDIISSLSLWLEINPEIKCHISWLWQSFLPHFGGEADTFIQIPDKGMMLPVGDIELEVVPAHYLHSPGNFNLYDRRAEILFTGDIGAALLPPDFKSIYVEDFDAHIQYMKGFHQRWMSSNTAKQSWCERVNQLDIKMLCPQHGAIFKGENVDRFLNWFSELEVGINTVL